jgi:hypothetical protein
MHAQAPVSPLLLPLLPSMPLLLPPLLLPSLLELLLPVSTLPELLPVAVESLPGPDDSLPVGPLDSMGSGLPSVVPGLGPVLVSLAVPLAGSVSVAGTSHSPMHTSSSPHADPNERDSPMAANVLRFMCTNLVSNGRERLSPQRRRPTAEPRREPTATSRPHYGHITAR